MVAFDDLPNEMIDNIVAHADDTDSLTFSAISQTSRRLRLITEPYLYEHVEIVSLNKDYTQFLAFVRTVLARPALGQRVRDLWLIWWKWTGPKKVENDVGPFPEPLDKYFEFPADEGSCPLALGDLKSILGMVQTQSDTTKSNEVVAANRWAPLAIILLHHLPRLRFLSIEQCRGLPSLIGTAARGTICGGIPAGLLSLRCITITTSTDQGPRLGRRDVAPFFDLPNIKDVTVSMDEGGAEDDTREEDSESDTTVVPSARNSSIHNLSLPDSAIGTKVIKWLLDQIHTLEIFSITLTEGSYEFEPWELGQQLYIHRASLRVIQIDLESDLDWEAFPIGLASLPEFSVLECLEVSLGTLVGLPFQVPSEGEDVYDLIDLMPPSLGYLDISLQDGWKLEELANLLSLQRSWSAWRRDRLPNLVRFRVGTEEKPSEQMRKIYECAGIPLFSSTHFDLSWY